MGNNPSCYAIYDLQLVRHGLHQDFAIIGRFKIYFIDPFTRYSIKNAGMFRYAQVVHLQGWMITEPNKLTAFVIRITILRFPLRIMQRKVTDTKGPGPR